MLKLLVILSLCSAISAEGWSYPGPWGSPDYPVCEGDSQSPINFEDETTEFGVVLPSLEFSAGYFDRLVGHLVNNGHTVKFGVDDGEAYIKGGPLPAGEQYDLAQFHFHWGNETHGGSEHTYEDIRPTGEMHLVHKNAKYATLEEALENADGLAVMGFFLLADSSKKPFAKLNRLVSKVKNVEDQIDGIEANMVRYLKSLDLSEYWTYSGSLTTPTCNEVVTWMVFHGLIPISYAFSEKLMKLKTGNEDHPFIKNNYRQVQPLNGRSVRATFSYDV